MSIICIFRLIYKLQVKGRKKEKENIYLNFPTHKQFNCYFLKWALLVPFITFRQVLESSSSLGKTGEVSIS